MVKKQVLNSFIAGIYATSPNNQSWNEASEKKYFDEIKNAVPNLRGLELPFFGEGLHPFDDGFLLREFDKNWLAAMTCIPAAMMGLEKNAEFGLASNNEEQRKNAVQMHAKAAQAVRKINDHFGRKVIPWVQFASGPSFSWGESISSKESLLKSMEELSKLDWQGAELCIEHCDSAVREGVAPVKGFLSLDDELWVLNALDNEMTGMTINWGRSAIETRSANGPLEHLQKVIAKGKLKGLIFSGAAADEGSAYGLWQDRHAPFNEMPGSEYPEPSSLMGSEQLRACLEEFKKSDAKYLGFKIHHEPASETTMGTRIGVNRDAAQALKREL